MTEETIKERTPDEWCLLKTPENMVRVFGSWRNSYPRSDNWRLSSGIDEITEDEDCYVFRSENGTNYRCSKDQYGIKRAYTRSVLRYLDYDPVSLVELKAYNTKVRRERSELS